MSSSLQQTKMFKAGNSYGLRVSKKVSPDGNMITFTKVDATHPELDSFIDDFYAKNGDLMKDLEDK